MKPRSKSETKDRKKKQKRHNTVKEYTSKTKSENKLPVIKKFKEDY